MFNIKISYLIVVLSLIFWSTFAYFTMHEQISNQQRYAKIINISGKQRMLSQKTTLIAKRVFETNDDKLLNHFAMLTDLMKKDHQFMLDNLTTIQMKNIYYNAPSNLDRNVKQYFTLLDSFKKDKNITILKEIEEYSFTLLGKLNYAVNEFEKESDKNTEVLMQRELFIFLGTLITIFFEIILIILPTIRKVNESEKKMSKFNTTLREKIDEQKKIILQDALENQEKEKIIHEQERQASIGELIGNIAHHWRQPLSVISTGASGMKVQKEYGLLTDKDFYKICDSINENAQYLSTTISNFNSLIKKDTIQKKYNLSSDINTMLQLMKETFTEEDITVTLNIIDDIQIHGFEHEFAQCIINLINNSKDALSQNQIESKNIDISAFKTKNGEIQIQIKDNGGGISEQIISNIFDPYFTTKHKTQGRGLGLHMVYKFIVQTMHGSIKVKNITYTYKGTTYIGALFTITLASA